jgi:hypothetical protein
MLSLTRSTIQGPSKLGDPYARTSSMPVSRTTKDLVADHNLKFPRPEDRGGLKPYQGESTILRDGTKGGAPMPYIGQLTRLGVGQLIDGAGVDLNNRQRKAIADDARRLNAQMIVERQRPITIRPGIGGLDVATALRAVPDAPSGSRGVLRDLKTRKETGRFAQDFTGPKSLLDKLRTDRTIGTAPATKAIAPSAPTNSPGGTPSAQFVSGAVSLADFAKATAVRIGSGGAQGATTKDLHSSSNERVLMIAGALALVFFVTR